MRQHVAPSVTTVASTVSIRTIRGLVDCAEQAGIARRRLLLAAQLDARILDSDVESISNVGARRLLEAMLDLSKDPAFGLRWALRQNTAAVSPVSYLVAHAGTLREGLESLSRFRRLISDHQSFYIAERDDVATLVCPPLPELSLRAQRLAAEMLTSCMFRLIRAHGPAAAPAQVSFQYPAPPYHLEYTQVFERPPRFDQAFTGIVFDRALLDRASPHRDHATHRALVAVAEGELARITRQTPCFRRATEYLVSRGAASEVRMEEVARSLGMSVRSLRRRLVAEGRTYRAVEQDAHAIVAQQHLRSPQLSIEETALKMGFAHPSAFYRAFKRWTGMTPLEFREQAETTHKAAP